MVTNGLQVGEPRARWRGERTGSARATCGRRGVARGAPDSGRDLSATRKLQVLDFGLARVAPIIPVSCIRAVDGIETAATQPGTACSSYPQAVRWIEGAPMPATTKQTRWTEGGGPHRRRAVLALLVIAIGLVAWVVAASARPTAAPLGTTSPRLDGPRLDPPASPRLETNQPESPPPLD